MIGTITHILAKAGYKAMNGPLADERRRLAGAVPPAAYVSYDPRLLAGAGWYGYRIALKGGDRSMLERARYMLKQQYVIRDRYEYYADDIYTLGVMLRQRVPHYGIGGGGAAQEPDALNFYMPDGGTITLTKNGSPTVVELEYSIDGGATWQIWEEVDNVRSLTLTVGQKMYVRNTSETSTSFGTSANNYYNFAFSENCEAAGKVNSLLCKNPDNAMLSNYCFRRLFYQSKLTKVSDLTSTVSASYCYYSMFESCHYLEEPPAVMLQDAKSGCCYAMFNNCTSLRRSPELLPVYASDLSYYIMFQGCLNLKTVNVHFTSYYSDAINNWLRIVADTGDFYCPAELTIPTGSSGIPSGWTRHDI